MLVEHANRPGDILETGAIIGPFNVNRKAANNCFRFRKNLTEDCGFLPQSLDATRSVANPQARYNAIEM